MLPKDQISGIYKLFFKRHMAELPIAVPAAGKIKPAIVATFIKLIGLAAIFLPIGVMLGYTHEHLIALIVMLGSASTVSCFVMAKNMGHDGTLTSSVVVLTTLFSALTMTGWLFIFRTMGLV